MDGKRWRHTKPDFFIHAKPLSILIRAKFKQALKDAGFFQDVPANVRRQKWVCHIEPVGNGENVLKYLAPYIFRVAISDKNILHYDEETVTFRYKDAEYKTISTCRLNTFEFMRRFLQHVLPRGFVKVWQRKNGPNWILSKN
ncbi:transposase [candidate division KSB1 bacterium]|nr:transposase [candidate division KSB1 bacterium]